MHKHVLIYMQITKSLVASCTTSTGLQELSEETLKGHCVNLHIKLNSDRLKTFFCEKLNPFRKIVPQESVLDVLQTSILISEIYPNVVMVYKILLTRLTAISDFPHN